MISTVIYGVKLACIFVGLIASMVGVFFLPYLVMIPFTLFV